MDLVTGLTITHLEDMGGPLAFICNAIILLYHSNDSTSGTTASTVGIIQITEDITVHQICPDKVTIHI